MTIRTKRFAALSTTISTIALTFASCAVRHDRFATIGTDVKIDVKSVTLRSDQLQTSLDLSSFIVTKSPGKHPCDVKIWVQADANGDGKISDDEKREVYSSAGAFTSYSRQSQSLKIQGEVKSATLVVESRDSKDKDRAPERQSFGINRDGIHRLSREKPASVVMTSGRSNDHFLEVISVGSRAIEVSIGDLRARAGSTLSNLSRGGKPDFLAAVVLANNNIVAVLGGKDIVSARLPRLHGSIGGLRVVTLDRSLRICGDFSVGGIHAQ